MEALGRVTKICWLQVPCFSTCNSIHFHASAGVRCAYSNHSYGMVGDGRHGGVVAGGWVGWWRDVGDVGDGGGMGGMVKGDPIQDALWKRAVV